MNHHPERSEVHADRGSSYEAITDELDEERTGEIHCISKVTVILPLHNEAENIKSTTLNLRDHLLDAGYVPSIVLIDDGSTDTSLEIAVGLSALNHEVSYISFSRNFGKEAAIMAGLRECGDDFDVVAYMDSDGQHNPADLVRMLEEATSSDVDLVCGARVDRDYQTTSQRWMASQFYKFFHALTDTRIEEGIGDFNVLKPKVVHTLRELEEEKVFMKGLIAWIGFDRRIVPITIQPRAGGMPKSSLSKLLKLAAGAFLSFSAWPLRAWSIIGMASATIAVLYLIFLIVGTIVFGREVPGYATTISLILGIGGLQLFSVGILGEYVARIYTASKQRPRYIISKRSNETG